MHLSIGVGASHESSRPSLPLRIQRINHPAQPLAVGAEDLVRDAVINCRLVAEAANAPMTPAGERVLLDRGIEILPAILCSAGGVTVSYFEWVQNRSQVYWDAERVDEELNRHMVLAARRVQLARHRYNVDMRTAAYIAALDQLGKLYKLRGIFP